MTEKNEQNHVEDIAQEDAAGLEEARKHYADSWRCRGGIGAFMMLARKWDRIENRLKQPPTRLTEGDEGEAVQTPAFAQYDVFGAILADQRSEGILDDIRDLRRYLNLVEAHMRDAHGINPPHRDNA